METISLKVDKKLLQEIDGKLQEHRYSTRTEFIRDAIRTKLTDLEKEAMIKALDRIKGSSKHRTTDEDLHRAGEIAFARLEKKHGLR